MIEASPPLGKRVLEPPVGKDLGDWAAAEVTKHEELCGLRYEAIGTEMKAIRQAMAEGLTASNARTKAVEDKIAGAVRWVMGIVGSLCVALLLMFLNNAHTQQQADESDKREMRARLSLLTQQLANTAPRALVVTPPGTQTTAIPSAPAPPLDPADLNDSVSGPRAK